VAIFETTRYPAMAVRTPHGVVRFEDGRAEATPAQAKVLRSMPDEYGLTEVKTAAKAKGGKPEGA
jgi:hypothetical protein